MKCIWTGPYTFIGTHNETAYMSSPAMIPHGITDIRQPMYDMYDI